MVPRGLTNLKTCVRCGSNLNIEEHHKIPKYKGGKDTKKNKELLCKSCHDFKHAEIYIKDKLKYYRKRVKLLKHRLEVLRSLNTPNKILSKGYRSYWVDETTHNIK